jgi:hypothetical protein
MISKSSYIEKLITEAGLSDAKSSSFPLDPGYLKITDENFLENNKLYRKFIGMLFTISSYTFPSGYSIQCHYFKSKSGKTFSDGL